MVVCSLRQGSASTSSRVKKKQGPATLGISQWLHCGRGSGLSPVGCSTSFRILDACTQCRFGCAPSRSHCSGFQGLGACMHLAPSEIIDVTVTVNSPPRSKMFRACGGLAQVGSGGSHPPNIDNAAPILTISAPSLPPAWPSVFQRCGGSCR